MGLYSITFLGVWYQGKALTVEQVIGKAKEYGYDGVEIDGKRPHGNPNDWPTKRCRELRSMADGEGIEIYAVAGNNDFSSPICEHRESQIVYLRELIRMASDLGARTVRVFFAWPGVTTHPQLATYTLARNIWDSHAFADDRRGRLEPVPGCAGRVRPLCGGLRRDAGAAEPRSYRHGLQGRAADDPRRSIRRS